MSASGGLNVQCLHSTRCTIIVLLISTVWCIDSSAFWISRLQYRTVFIWFVRCFEPLRWMKKLPTLQNLWYLGKRAVEVNMQPIASGWPSSAQKPHVIRQLLLCWLSAVHMMFPSKHSLVTCHCNFQQTGSIPLNVSTCPPGTSKLQEWLAPKHWPLNIEGNDNQHDLCFKN